MPILILINALPCSVQAFPDVKYGKRIHVLPIDDTVEGITGWEGEKEREGDTERERETV